MSVLNMIENAGEQDLAHPFKDFMLRGNRMQKWLYQKEEMETGNERCKLVLEHSRGKRHFKLDQQRCY